MFRSQSRLIGYLLSLALAAIFLPAQASAQKKQQNAVYSPPTLSLTADNTTVSACQGSSQVRLDARASSPGGNPIRYRWSTSAGAINGNGASVNWDLSGLAPGVYKAYVDIETGNNDGECNAFTSTTVVVKPCPPVRPTCPNVEIICPTDIVVDQPLTFSSNVPATPGVTPMYNWSVSAGSIIEGQGTPTIKVDTTGLAGQTIKATLSMGGYTQDCSASCAVSIPVPEAKCRKFDEFPDISRNDEKARLDNYGVELQNDPTSTAYVVVHPGRSGKPGEVQKHTTRIVDYLVNSRGIDAHRVVTLVGGARDELMVELWSCPQGATPPNP
ncbi:MAG TPA: hypothetical protein VI306_14510 [Pyrinomonadaceae bacterium]